MTTEELQQKHYEVIADCVLNIKQPVPTAAKQCALITLEHTIGVLSNLYKKSSAGNVFADILSEMDELIKQKEQL